MRTIFLDTSYLLALIRKRDARHEDALTASTNHSGPFITTDLVLVELANCLARIKGTLPFFRLFSAMLRLPRTVFAGIPHCVTQR